MAFKLGFLYVGCTLSAAILCRRSPFSSRIHSTNFVQLPSPCYHQLRAVTVETFVLSLNFVLSPTSCTWEAIRCDNRMVEMQSTTSTALEIAIERFEISAN